jgi:hypothetical protein
MGAGPVPPSTTATPMTQNAAARPVTTASVTPPVAAATTPHRYHVQAASPGLAMLSDLDVSGGEGRPLAVSPGDTVFGWGKVISIGQRGTTWIVKTDHGLIQ